ncbi:hypothetical protein DOM21_11315 [Bacteriovorax stolpii]|uniref:hypothetical protein n=1 Tax=Bacteriovorax stolpii TaxID=960 RepID=UPI0011592515|nr:hypothetical protein [Bacteriovorax stolpii]QDK42025.1 hypothetical protein DOM21_11315 [Bacteriovorax stolpii]
MRSLFALSCSQNGTVFFYNNGVNVEDKDAQKNIVVIKDKINIPGKDNHDSKSTIETKFIYNSTCGLFNDIKEIYNQATRNLSGAQRVYYNIEKGNGMSGDII